MNKKIDLIVRGKYYASTNDSRTCREAKAKFYIRYISTGITGAFLRNSFPGLKETEIKAFFDHDTIDT